MSDDLMKRAREWLQSCVNAATRSGVPEEADLEAFILAHIDGEPARTQAAVERAREEQREACWDWLDGTLVSNNWLAAWEGALKMVRNTPLTATPLADELRDEREVSQSLREQLIAAEREVTTLREHALSLERQVQDVRKLHDAAEARVAELEAELAAAHERLDEFGMRRDGTTATLVEGIDAMRARIDEYREWAYKGETATADLREGVKAWRVTSKVVVDENAALRARVAELEAELDAAQRQARTVLDKHPVKP